MKCFEKIFVVSAIALLIPLSASGTPYYSFTDSGGTSWYADDKTVGSYFSTESFNKYSVEDNNDRNAMKNIDTWHHDGYGVGLSIHKISMSGGHAPASAPVQPVPEPATMLLMGLGMFGLAYSIRSRWQRDS